jgi:adenylate kinase family enzyme
MRDSLAPRTIIIGNSGSGKSTLAAQLAAILQVPAINLDAIHWEEGGFAEKRDENLAREITAQASAAPAWVMEGVYGWLCSVALPRASALLWLDLPWEDCRKGLMARKSGQPVDEEMLIWAEQYWTRQTSSSLTGHQKIYTDFIGFKIRLRSRRDIADLLASL